MSRRSYKNIRNLRMISILGRVHYLWKVKQQC